MSLRRTSSLLVVLLALPVAASADTDRVDATPPATAAHALIEGDLGARAVPAGTIQLGGGWDRGRAAGFGEARAQVRVTPRLAVFGGAALTAGGARWRPSAGARLQVLDGRRRALDLAVAGAYKAEGFVEPEGELELTSTVGRQLGATYVFGELAYGQDPEGNERDAEAALGAAVPVGPVLVGAATRGRVSLGAKRDSAARWDVVTDLGVAIPLGTYALRLATGVAVVGLDRTELGAIASAAVGAAF